MRLLILGWDGASRQHIGGLRLPFLASLAHRGPLLPEDLFLGAYIDSANAWTTITTGATFREHRVLLFRYPPIRTESPLARGLIAVGGRRWLPEWPRRLLLNRVLGPLCKEKRASDGVAERWTGNFVGRLLPAVSTDVRFRRFWDAVPGPVLIFEVPLTYPAVKVDGVLVSGIPAPRYGDARHATVFPLDREESIRRRFSGYTYGDGPTPVQRPDRPNLGTYLRRLPKTQREGAAAFLSLAGSGHFELGFCMMRLIDDYLHADDAADGIELAYRTVDELSGDLVRAIRPDHVLVLSDHGMKPFRRPNSGVRMDHDTTQGIWASDLDLGLRRHMEVAATVAGVFDRKFRPTPARPDLEDEATSLDEGEVAEIEERLRQLGYL